MKQKYLILACSITYEMPLIKEWHDFTKSKLDDDDIIQALSDICAEYEQNYHSALVLNEADAMSLIDDL